jgi:hypothetical protein
VICNASVSCANRIGDAQGILRAEHRQRHGSVIARTRARSRPSTQCRGALGVSGSKARIARVQLGTAKVPRFVWRR